MKRLEYSEKVPLRFSFVSVRRPVFLCFSIVFRTQFFFFCFVYRLSECFTPQADVYSLGIVLWELASCQEPFAEYGFSFMSILEGQIVQGLR
jgi:hypothetical protein